MRKVVCTDDSGCLLKSGNMESGINPEADTYTISVNNATSKARPKRKYKKRIAVKCMRKRFVKHSTKKHHKRKSYKRR